MNTTLESPLVLNENPTNIPDIFFVSNERADEIGESTNEAVRVMVVTAIEAMKAENPNIELSNADVIKKCFEVVQPKTAGEVAYTAYVAYSLAEKVKKSLQEAAELTVLMMKARRGDTSALMEMLGKMSSKNSAPFTTEEEDNLEAQAQDMNDAMKGIIVGAPTQE